MLGLCRFAKRLYSPALAPRFFSSSSHQYSIKPIMPKTIGTHSGTFHCDEALACFMLKQLEVYKDAKLLRTRDQALLDTCDIVVDVGGTYDHEAKRYDHHQRGFDEQFSNNFKTKLSSAGLVYKHYGKDVIAAVLQAQDGKQMDENETEILYQKIYENFIEGIDGIDNGISQYPDDVEPAYKENTGLSARVGRLNPWWNEPEGDMDARFAKAMAMAGECLVERIRYYALAWLPGRQIVQEGFDARFDIDSSGRIVLFDRYCPWKDHMDGIEAEALAKQPDMALVAYVLYPDPAGAWRVQAVAEKPGSFKSRHPLPEAWCGLRDQALSDRAGIENCIFVHQSGFIGGNKTRDGAVELARKALTME